MLLITGAAPFTPTATSGRISGGVVLFVVQVVVEGDDGADELSQFHEVSRDDVDAALAGSLRPDPLHHAWQGSVEAGRITR